MVTERVSVNLPFIKAIGGANRILSSTTNPGLPCTRTLGGRVYQTVWRVSDEHEPIYMSGSRGKYA